MVTGITMILKVDEMSDEQIYNLRHENAGAAHICSHPIKQIIIEYKSYTYPVDQYILYGFGGIGNSMITKKLK